MTKLLLPPTAMSSTDGDHSDDNARRFAEILNQYDPALSLEYIPEADRQTASLAALLKPFRIVRTTAKFGREVLRYVTGEEMRRPQDLLVWVWEGDFARHRPDEVFNRIEKREQAERMLKLKADQDAAQERQDKLAWAFRGGVNRKHRLQLGRGRYLNT